MKKTIKKMFPWVVTLRNNLRINSFYRKMNKDKNTYSTEIVERELPHTQFEDKFIMINENTGFDIKYQENKIFNLKLASKTINNIVIKPGEVFSFWQLARFADKKIPYKDGLVVVDGELKTAYAGGLCHISNLLCWLFLHSPLTFLERVGHKTREFPYPEDMLIGIDATIMEGLVDLKVKNETEFTFQIQISFDEKYMYGKILTNDPSYNHYKIRNANLRYENFQGEIFEEVDIYREIYTKNNEFIDSIFLYKNRCHIGYDLQEDARLKEVAIWKKQYWFYLEESLQSITFH